MEHRGRNSGISWEASVFVWEKDNEGHSGQGQQDGRTRTDRVDTMCGADTVWRVWVEMIGSSDNWVWGTKEKERWKRALDFQHLVVCRMEWFIGEMEREWLWNQGDQGAHPFFAIWDKTWVFLSLNILNSTYLKVLNKIMHTKCLWCSTVNCYRYSLFLVVNIHFLYSHFPSSLCDSGGVDSTQRGSRESSGRRINRILMATVIGSEVGIWPNPGQLGPMRNSLGMEVR